MSATGIELISFHPINTHANIIKRKKVNNAANVMTANIAINNANILSMVRNILMSH